jgi:hypothetical protein
MRQDKDSFPCRKSYIGHQALRHLLYWLKNPVLFPILVYLLFLIVPTYPTSSHNSHQVILSLRAVEITYPTPNLGN